ncbi:ADPribosylation factor subfamily protein [Pelomyxa schiedti]|nr:ADPribosylation factor subfamily protein [Pelomyxa schiedti]
MDDNGAPWSSSSLPPLSFCCCYTWGCTSLSQLGYPPPLSPATATTVTTTSTAQLEHQSTPREVPGLPGPVAISCGARHMAAIAADGCLFTWGGPSSWSPTRHSFGRTTSIACDECNTYSTSSREVLKWSQVYISKSAPDIPGITFQEPSRLGVGWFVTSVSAGKDHTLAVTDTGLLWAVGKNTMGQLGMESTEEPVYFRPCTFPKGIKIVLASAGSNHSLAVDSEGRLYSWGCGLAGQLGHADEVSVRIPKMLTFFSTYKVREVSCGANHSLVVVEPGQLFSFGDNLHGQLGVGDNEGRNTPTFVSCLQSDVQHVAGGGSNYEAHSLALTFTNGLYGFGSNGHGQLGLGDEKDRNVPERICAVDRLVVSQISCGWASSACIAFSPRCSAILVDQTTAPELPRGFLSQLPPPIIREILFLLDFRSLCHLSQTCQAMYFFATENNLWKVLYSKESWGFRTTSTLPTTAFVPSSYTGGWKKLFSVATQKKRAVQKASFGSYLEAEQSSRFSFVSWIGKSLFSPKSMILVLGLDDAGKTTMLWKLNLGPVETTIPTIGFNVESVPCKNFIFTSWDVCRADRTRPRHQYYKQTCALIFVVDSHDLDRMPEAGAEFMRLVTLKELAGIPILVLANMQDWPQSLSVSEVSEFMSLHQLPQLSHKHWRIQGCSTRTGDGIKDGLDWLYTVLSQ